MRKILISKVSGLSGILAPIIAFCFITSSILLHPWFSWYRNSLSDLGSLETTYNLVYNLGIVITGILGLLFTLGLPELIKRRTGIIGTISFGSGMFFLVLVGILPLGMKFHNVVSIAFYTLTIAGILIIGMTQFMDINNRPWGIFIVSTLGLALFSIILLKSCPHDLGASVTEAIGALAISEFSIVFGGRTLGVI